MKIQLITERGMNNEKDIIVSKFSSPCAMDDFDFNVIDLSHEGIWRNSGTKKGGLNHTADLRSIAQVVLEAHCSKVLYVLPQNLIYKFDFYQTKYTRCDYLKNILGNPLCAQDFLHCFPHENLRLPIVFEKTKTVINEKEYHADFHFTSGVGESITKSVKSDKETTICFDKNIFITTLNICESSENLFFFLESLFERKVSDYPAWIKEYEFDNDREQKDNIKECNEKIEELQEKIRKSEAVLDENMKYKSILCSNGDSLVDVVFDILEQILDCDLSNFVDEKKEDFIIEIDETFFIGEIKGETSNVKSRNVCQLDTHCQDFIEKMKEENNAKKTYEVCGLLIINPLRNTKISEREPIHKIQVDLAERNNNLIIETSTLLKIYEAFRKQKISTEMIIHTLKTKKGLLRISDFDIFNT